MKKTFTVIILILSFSRIDALPVGNPSQPRLFFHDTLFCENECEPCTICPQRIGFAVGYYGDYVFNRHLETSDHRKIDYTQMATNAGYLALTFWEFFDVFATLGVTKFTFNTSLRPFNGANPSPKFNFETSTAFSWSIGSHWTLLEYRRFSLGLVAQYFSCFPKAKILRVRTNVNDYPSDSERKKYSEWQLASGISYRYNEYFIPYAAIKYAKAFWHFDHQTFLVTNTLATIPNLKNSKNWGGVIGVTFAPFQCKKAALTVEGRFADESAVHINAQFSF